MTQEQQNFVGIVITGVIALIVAGLNLYQNRRLKDVHELVNSRLDKALATIEDLRREISKLRTGQS